MQQAISYDEGDLLALIVADDGFGAAEADQAISLVDTDFRCRVSWREAANSHFDHHGPIELIVAEAQRVSDKVLSAALPRLSALQIETGARCVLAIDPEQIDLVAGTLLGEQIELLCLPTVAERAAAFAIGLSLVSRNVLHDRDSERGSAQLRQLNEEVTRISRVLSRLANGDRRAHGSRTLPYAVPVDAPGGVSPTSADIRRIIRGRRLRDSFFGEGLFEDPAWDMLLDLYAAELEGAQVSVSSLCIAAAVAPTTALRWIGRMTDMGLFVRQPDPFDRRRAFLALSDDARIQMQNYFAALPTGAF